MNEEKKTTTNMEALCIIINRGLQILSQKPLNCNETLKFILMTWSFFSGSRARKYHN